MNIKRNIFALATAALALSSCNKFLDQMPDNRTTLDTQDKVIALLVSAYPDAPYFVTNEFYSDNVDETAIANPDYSLLDDQLYHWQDVTAAGNDTPDKLWEACYRAIAAANHALEAIPNLPDSEELHAAKGEALLCRAYAHFILVNTFCQAYNPIYANEDLGVPYMDHAEKELNPQYERGTVAEVYAKIASDLEEGLPLVNDAIYKVPKYHFNVKAAYAFAARFYLFYQKWDKAIECANKVLGSAPAGMLRDWAANGALGLQSADGKRLLRTMDYIDYAHKCNLLLMTSVTEYGVAWGPYRAYTRFAHGNWLDQTETFRAITAPWGRNYSPYSPPYSDNNGTTDKAYGWRIPYLFEYKDPVNQIGFPHAVTPVLTTDETLLVRAEAYIMQKNYTAALEDMNLWVQNYCSGSKTMTLASINSWASDTDFHKAEAPTTKKKFDAPAFPIEAGDQEAMCYAIVHMRRVETCHLGLRLYDVKRYGITMTRRKLLHPTQLDATTGELKPRDPRCAVQIPSEVILAGLPANPR